MWKWLSMSKKQDKPMETVRLELVLPGKQPSLADLTMDWSKFFTSSHAGATSIGIGTSALSATYLSFQVDVNEIRGDEYNVGDVVDITKGFQKADAHTPESSKGIVIQIDRLTGADFFKSGKDTRLTIRSNGSMASTGATTYTMPSKWHTTTPLTFKTFFSSSSV